MIAQKISRGMRYFKKNGWKKTLKKTIQRLRNFDEERNGYARFCKAHELSEEDLNLQRKQQRQFLYRPCISIVVPLYETKETFLRELIDSVLAQTYDNWQLCLADGSQNNDLGETIAKWYPKEQRICYRYLGANLGIAGNTNAALDMATGEYIALGDHDDTLTPDALFWNVKVFNENKEIDCVYSDEDKLDMKSGKYFMPHFKSDFNQELLRCHNYITHFFVFAKKLYEQVGGFESCYDGAQDYDMILRCTEKAQCIYHIPRVLYHWRCHEQSTAMNPESKTYTWENGRKALQSHLDRLCIPAKAELDNHMGFYRVEYQWNGLLDKNVLVIRTGHALEHEATMHMIQETEAEFILFLDEHIVAQRGQKGICWKSGEVRCLNEFSTDVCHMAGILMQPDVAVVGAKILYKDDSIRHSLEITNKESVVKEAFLHLNHDDDGYFFRNRCTQDVSVVSTECMLVKRDEFLQMDGFEHTLQYYCGEDYCLRMRQRGKRIVYMPFAEWIYQPYKRYVDINLEEIHYMKKRWQHVLEKGDFCYNPNLNLNACDFTYAK